MLSPRLRWETTIVCRYKKTHNNIIVLSRREQNETERKRKIDKYLDIARELNHLWNMKLTMILDVVRTLIKGLKSTLEELYPEEESEQ